MVNRFLTPGIQMAALVIAIIFHEVAHGYVAWKLGDPTARRANRLTLNPLAHLDLFGSVLLPLFLLAVKSPVLFAWAKPVPLDPRFFTDPRRGIMLVGAAGPMTNLSLAIVSAVLIRALDPSGLALLFLLYLCLTNVVLGVFNLIPLPPLDGSRILLGILPAPLARLVLRLEPFGFVMIFALLWMGALEHVISPAVTFLVRILLGAS